MIALPGETALTIEPERPRESPQLLAAVARASTALARHPLLPAVLYRARLDAARRAAAVDGQAIDPWHLAAVCACAWTPILVCSIGARSLMPRVTPSTSTSGW
jgi:hypothetical protein